MNRQIAIALRLTVLLTILLGVAYPLFVTVSGQLIFPAQADGSLVIRDGEVVGSSLIGQTFTGREYFHPRPSAAGKGYDGLASGASNLGPTNKALAQRIETEIARLRAEDPGIPPRLPADMVTASGSGLDPDISPANARLQAARVASARGVGKDRVVEIVDRMTAGPALGIMGAARVNVLLLNLALDREIPLRQ